MTTDLDAHRRAAHCGLVTATHAGLAGARALVEAAAIARESLGGPAYDWDRLRVLNAEELEQSRRLAERADQEHPFPIKAIRVSRQTGEIVGVLMRQVSDVVHQRRPAASRHPARRRNTANRNARARSPSGSDSEPQPPRRCPGCGEEFTPSRANQRHCQPGCRVRAHRRRTQPEQAVRGEARVEPFRGDGIDVRDLERYKRRHDELVRQAGDPSEIRRRVEALAERRLKIWSLLPAANGDSPALRAEVEEIEHAIASGWDAIRTAEAVAA